jgi:hypothetical protein
MRNYVSYILILIVFFIFIYFTSNNSYYLSLLNTFSFFNKNGLFDIYNDVSNKLSNFLIDKTLNENKKTIENLKNLHLENEKNFNKIKSEYINLLNKQKINSDDVIKIPT